MPENLLKEFNKTVIGQDDIFYSLTDIINRIMPTQLLSAVKQTFGVMTNQEVTTISGNDLNFENDLYSAVITLMHKEMRIYVNIIMYCNEKDLVASAKLIRNTNVSINDGAIDSYIDIVNTIAGRIRAALEEKGIKLGIVGAPKINKTEKENIVEFLIELPFRTQFGEKFLVGLTSYRE